MKTQISILQEITTPDMANLRIWRAEADIPPRERYARAIVLLQVTHEVTRGRILVSACWNSLTTAVGTMILYRQANAFYAPWQMGVADWCRRRGVATAMMDVVRLAGFAVRSSERVWDHGGCVAVPTQEGAAFWQAYAAGIQAGQLYQTRSPGAGRAKALIVEVGDAAVTVLFTSLTNGGTLEQFDPAWLRHHLETEDYRFLGFTPIPSRIAEIEVELPGVWKPIHQQRPLHVQRPSIT